MLYWPLFVVSLQHLLNLSPVFKPIETGKLVYYLSQEYAGLNFSFSTFILARDHLSSSLYTAYSIHSYLLKNK